MKTTPPLIAIVDDDESVRNAIGRLLRSTGMNVETFSSGAEFLDAVAKRTFDCVVLDQHMPGMSGLNVQAQLAGSGNWLPIIIVTGNDDPYLRVRALEGGAAAYLLKPIEDQVLIEAIEAAI